MDYEKKYKEALNRAREIHRNEDEKRHDMEWLFPELKNKDEEIRKALIKGVESCKASGWTNFGNNVDIDVVLAWLKEQGKQKPINYNKELKKCRENPLYFFDKYVKLEKQKPACSEEDESVKKRILLSLEKDLMATKNSGCDTQDLEQCIVWLEKQGESYTKKDVDAAYLKGICDAKNELGKQGEQKTAVTDFNAKDWYVSKVDGKIHDMTYNPADKVEPIFSIGDVLCDKSCTTLNKNSQPNIEILDIRDGMYICNNCSFPISQQDEYELVAKKIEDEIEIQFGAKDSELQEATYYIPKGFHAEIDDDKVVIKKGEKSTWSNEDETIRENIEGALDYYEGMVAEDWEKEKEWLKSIKNRIGG